MLSRVGSQEGKGSLELRILNFAGAIIPDGLIPYGGPCFDLFCKTHEMLHLMCHPAKVHITSVDMRERNMQLSEPGSGNAARMGSLLLTFLQRLGKNANKDWAAGRRDGQPKERGLRGVKGRIRVPENASDNTITFSIRIVKYAIR